MIQSVLKAIKILDLFSPAEPRLSLTEISRRLDIPKSTAFNLLDTLVTGGYVERVEGDRYALGTAIIGLTQSVRVNVELRDHAAPFLRGLADSAQESVYLTVLEGTGVLYIYAIESSRRLVARTAVGERAPLYCTSVGKAILAFLPAEEAARLLQEMPLRRFTASTLVDRAALQEELARTRERGYALDRQEHEERIFCVGAPIFNRRGRAIGACSISGTDAEIVSSRLPELSASIMHAAYEISRHIGYIPARTSAFRSLSLPDGW